MCGHNLPAVMLPNLSSGLNSRCLPPDLVTCLRVRGRLACSYQCIASACWRSQSTTTNLSPVGTPTSASGKSLHHSRIWAGSAVASLNPCLVSGFLSAPQGNTAISRAASLSASEAVLIGAPPPKREARPSRQLAEEQKSRLAFRSLLGILVPVA